MWGLRGCDAWYGYVSGHLHIRESGWCACVCAVWVHVSVVCAICCVCVCVCVCMHTHTHSLLFSLTCGLGASPSRATCPFWGFAQGEGQQHIRSRQKVGGEVWELKRFFCESLSVQAAFGTTEDLLILALFSDERLRFSQPTRAAGSTTAARPHKEQPAPNMTAMEESQAPGLCPGSPHSGAVGLEPRNSRPRATRTAVDYEGGRTGRAASDPPLNHTSPLSST